MRINTNINSNMIRNDMAQHSQSLERIAERVSSGKRINRASDDAAGLAISERMKSDVRGTAQGIRNAIDGVSLIQTTEGALSNIEIMLQRSRELIIQGANGVNSIGDKAVIQQEIDQISIGISDIIGNTTFNSQAVFSDSADLSGTAALEYWLSTSWLPEASKLIEDNFGINARDQNIELIYDSDGIGNKLAYVSFGGFDAGFGGSKELKLSIDLADFTQSGYPSGDASFTAQDRIIAHEVVHAVMASNMNMNGLPGWFTEGAAEFIHGADGRVAGDISLLGTASDLVDAAHLKTDPGSPTTSAGYSLGYVATRMLHDASSGGIKSIMASLASGATFDAALAANTSFTTQALFETDILSNGVAYIAANMNLTDVDTGSIHGSDFGGPAKSSLDVISNEPVASNSNNLNLTGLSENTDDTSINIQLGSISVIQIDRIFVDNKAMSVSGIKVENSEDALARIDEAIRSVSTHQGTLGALHNRLEHSIKGLSIFQEQTSAAKSRILDSDFANETAQMSRLQVMMQAAQAMLAQSNVAPQQVLQLLQ